MRYFLRWWETLGKAERIVAMSLATGGVVAIVNSTAWAIAVSYMERQRALVAIAGYRRAETSPAGSTDDGDDTDDEEQRPANTGAPAAVSTADGVVRHVN
ncbi:MAG TPA: hypothetical protein VGS80_14370 [Ktedonobacterales bacterium]|jgi:hypothetical protein|nr:hypothetical protein [Ktedonobacterales bacterium]